jgi:hypothetical protein
MNSRRYYFGLWVYAWVGALGVFMTCVLWAVGAL